VSPRERAAALRGVRFAGLRFTPDFVFFAVAMTADIIADSRRDCKASAKGERRRAREERGEAVYRLSCMFVAPRFSVKRAGTGGRQCRHAATGSWIRRIRRLAGTAAVA
jgi:hypothetical protein